jgi:hypothetical protein
MARSKHADQYTTFIRAGRTAKAQTYLTRKEGDETDVDLGMTPYRCVGVCMGGGGRDAHVLKGQSQCAHAGWVWIDKAPIQPGAHAWEQAGVGGPMGWMHTLQMDCAVNHLLDPMCAAAGA